MMKKVLFLMTIYLLANPLGLYASTKKQSEKYVPPIEKDFPATNKAKSDTKTEKPSYLDNVSGSLALTSNYVFRGISLTENNPAFQGGLSYTFPLGVYATVWGSNANYNAPNGKKVTNEIDTTLGVQGKIKTDFTYDVDFVRYNYPGARDANYNELNTLWGYKVFTLGISYSGNTAGTHASGTYVNGLLNLPIPPCYAFNIQDLSFQAETGHYSLAKKAGESYNDYMLGLTKELNKTYTIMAQWTATNGRSHEPPYDGNKFVGTIEATF